MSADKYPSIFSRQMEAIVYIFLIIKITISSIVIGLKNFYFPLIHLPSCYRTVCYWTVCHSDSSISQSHSKL